MVAEFDLQSFQLTRGDALQNAILKTQLLVINNHTDLQEQLKKVEDKKQNSK